MKKGIEHTQTHSPTRKSNQTPHPMLASSLTTWPSTKGYHGNLTWKLITGTTTCTTIVVHTCDMRTRPRQHGGYPFIYCLFPDFKLRPVASIHRATTSIPNSYANPPNKYHECVGKTTSPGTRLRVKACPLVSIWGVAGGGPISYQGTIIMPPKRNLPSQT